MTTKNTHGGPGRGGGRKSRHSEPLKNVTIAMTDTQKVTLARIGGNQTLRDWLDVQSAELNLCEDGMF